MDAARQPGQGGSGQAASSAAPSLAAPSLAAPPLDRFVEMPQIPRWAGRLVYALVALIVAFGIWSALAKIDVVVRAEGRLIAPNDQISMQVYETAVVKSIDVRIGQQVKKGEHLATLDPTFTSADRDDLKNQVAALSAAKERIQAEIDGRPYAPRDPDTSATAQLRIYRQRQAERESHVTSLEKKIAELTPQLEFTQSNEALQKEQRELARQMVVMNEQLAAKGLSLQRQVIEAKAKELDALSKLNENKQDQTRLAEQITAAASDRDAYINEWSRKLAEEYEKTANDLDTAAVKLAKAARRSDLIAMISPVDGSVLDVPKRNIGSVLREGETLLTLVPTDKAMPLDLAVESKDVAYLHVGQSVRIKFESLPYQEYGSAYGTLIALTSDTTSDNAVSQDKSSDDSRARATNERRFYRAQVHIDRTDMRNLPDGFQFRPGMKASADIKVGLRTVAAYLLHPLTRAFDEGLHER
jgi:hemolysin D